MKKIMMAASVAALACGCVSVNKNDGGNSCLKPCTIKDRVHVKYEVGKDRVQASDQLNCLFGWICWGSTAHIADQGEFGFGAQAKAKNGAYANACDAAKCDSLAAARASGRVRSRSACTSSTRAARTACRPPTS